MLVDDLQYVFSVNAAPLLILLSQPSSYMKCIDSIHSAADVHDVYVLLGDHS